MYIILRVTTLLGPMTSAKMAAIELYPKLEINELWLKLTLFMLDYADYDIIKHFPFLSKHFLT